MSDARDDLGYLELRWAPDDDDVNRLRVRAASAAGFAGSGSGWFNRAPVEAFAARLQAYPPADGDPPELKTGLMEPSDASYLLQVRIRVYPVGNRGQLGISVELATEPWSAPTMRAEEHESVALEVRTTYERLGTFGRDLSALLDGRTDVARIEGEHLL